MNLTRVDLLSVSAHLVKHLIEILNILIDLILTRVDPLSFSAQLENHLGANFDNVKFESSQETNY